MAESADAQSIGAHRAPLQFPEPPTDLQRPRWWLSLKYFGPGAIIASVTIGSGETVWASRSGAIFGYTLFWAFTVLIVMKAVQVYTAARYFTLTGEHPAERWAQLPGPRGWFPGFTGLFVIITFPMFLSALPIMLGTITAWIVTGDPGRHPHVWATVFILLFIGLTLAQSYGFFEKAQTVIVLLMLLVMVIATLAAKPNWLAAFLGAVVPTAPRYEEWVQVQYPEIARRTLWIELVAYMGVIGGGVQDYVGYVGMMREKKWGLIGARTEVNAHAPIAADEENVRRGRLWLRAPTLDVVVSFGSVIFFCMTFLILGAVLLHEKKIVPTDKAMDLYTQQVVFLTQLHQNPTVQSCLRWLYQLGVWCAIAGTVYGAYEIYVRTAYECIRASVPKWRGLDLSVFRRWTLLYTGVAGIALVWIAYATKWGPLSIMTIPLHIAGVFLAGPWCFAMVWADRKFLPKPFQMGWLLVVLNLLCGIAFTLFGARALYDDVIALMK